MATTTSTALRPEKRAAILGAARAVFAELGFTGATIDAIAREANVSTRTLYKHFRNKDDLFATVVHDSAAAVADDYEAAVRSGVAEAASLRARLRVLAVAATKQALGHPEHFTMMRQIAPEAAQLPAGVLEDWRETGPDRVERETMAQLGAMRDDGELEIVDLRRAARHFLALASAEGGDRRPAKRADADAAIDAAVAVFARGYAPRTGPGEHLG